MPATALAPHRLVEQPAFRAEIVKYVAYAYRQGRVKRADFDDVVQQIWAEVALGVTSFRPEKGTFDNWVRCIALNVVRHHVRGKKRYDKRFCEFQSNVMEQAAFDPSPERCLQRKQARGAISEALNNLPEQQTNVLLLHVVDDMSHGEIGESVGISESASQKCFQRTRNKLAQCLSSELLSAMPPFVTGCDEPTSSEGGFRWYEWSHRSGQIIAAVLAFLCFVPFNRGADSRASAPGEIRVAVSGRIDSMSQLDKPSVVHDEPTVHRDAPAGKLEPASLPSVPAVPKPTRGADKPGYVLDLAPLPPFKPTEHTVSHRPRGR
jgi:RNA polymerase sigma factor (sigma-70 family)